MNEIKNKWKTKIEKKSRGKIAKEKTIEKNETRKCQKQNQTYR